MTTSLGPGGGRKNVLLALWNGPQEGMATQDLSQILGVTRAPIKRTLKRLRDEGLVETIALKKFQNRRRVLHRLTDTGRNNALSYAPPRTKHGGVWGRASSTLQAVVDLLLVSQGTFLTAPQIATRTALLPDSVRNILDRACSKKLVTVKAAGTATYGYRLTALGAKEAKLYLEATPPLKSTVHRVILTSADNPQALALLEELRQMPGVIVQP